MASIDVPPCSGAVSCGPFQLSDEGTSGCEGSELIIEIRAQWQAMPAAQGKRMSESRNQRGSVYAWRKEHAGLMLSEMPRLRHLRKRTQS